MRSNQPAQSTFDRRHAVVIGGSMAGLLAARVLSDHFAQVTMIERDRLINDAEPRKGVPQGKHVHALLARGAAIMGKYFPDLFPTLPAMARFSSARGMCAGTSSASGWRPSQVTLKPRSRAVRSLSSMCETS